MIASVRSEPFIIFIRFRAAAQVKVAHVQRRRRRHFAYIWRVIDKLACSVCLCVCVCVAAWLGLYVFGATFMRHLNQLIAHNFPWRENFCVMFNYFHIYVNAFYQSLPSSLSSPKPLCIIPAVAHPRWIELCAQLGPKIVACV